MLPPLQSWKGTCVCVRVQSSSLHRQWQLPPDKGATLGGDVLKLHKIGSPAIPQYMHHVKGYSCLGMGMLQIAQHLSRVGRLEVVAVQCARTHQANIHGLTVSLNIYLHSRNSKTEWHRRRNSTRGEMAPAAEWYRQPVLGTLLEWKLFRNTGYPVPCKASFYIRSACDLLAGQRPAGRTMQRHAVCIITIASYRAYSTRIPWSVRSHRRGPWAG